MYLHLYRGRCMMGYITYLTYLVINVIANRCLLLLDWKVIWISHQFYLNVPDQIFMIQCRHDIFYWLSILMHVTDIYYNTVVLKMMWYLLNLEPPGVLFTISSSWNINSDNGEMINCFNNPWGVMLCLLFALGGIYLVYIEIISDK